MRDELRISASEIQREFRLTATYDELVVHLSSGVPVPNFDSIFLLECAVDCLSSLRIERALDIGTGGGLLPLELARRGVEVTTIDINHEATLQVRANAELNRVERRLTALTGDMLGPVTGLRFDAIFSSPPQLPTPACDARQHWTAFANDGGADGREMIDHIIGSAPAHLAQGGMLMLLQLDCISVDKTLELMARAGFAARVAKSASREMGPLSYERRYLWRADGDQYNVYVLEGFLK